MTNAGQEVRLLYSRGAWAGETGQDFDIYRIFKQETQ